jgi:hypothetical protein
MADAPTPPRRRWRWYAVFVVPAFAGLAGVLIAIALGYAPGRLWPVAGFLALWALAAGYVSVARRAFQRRAHRLRDAPVPRGIRLTTPAWIILDRVMTILGVLAIPGTIVAALGFPGIGVGVLLVVALVAVVTGFGSSGVMDIGALTFEATGLRFHIGRASCLVPWNAIGTPEPIGPDHSAMIRLQIGAPDQLPGPVSPDTEKDRARMKSSLGHGYVLLEAWIAGLDPKTLARTITECAAGIGEQVN